MAQDYIYEDYVCPKPDGFFPHETQCDAYWHCEGGYAEFKLCGNGLSFDDTDDTRAHCNYRFTIDCGNRTEFGRLKLVFLTIEKLFVKLVIRLFVKMTEEFYFSSKKAYVTYHWLIRQFIFR